MDTTNLTERLAALSPRQRDLTAQRLREARGDQGPDSSLTSGPQRLVAYFTGDPGQPTPDPATLRGFLSESLPSFMVPTTFTPLSELPLMPNGKVDRRVLLARPIDRPSGSPRDQQSSIIENQLMRIWDEILVAPGIRPEDNFFDLGGHSLVVPRLIERIRCDFGTELPLGVIFEAPTIRELAARIQAGNPRQSWSPVVPIRESGNRPPLFLVHGLGGEIGYFYDLAKYLHRDQPLYGIQAPADPFSELEPMATYYLDELRARQPKGPYLLGGYCVGGCIAFEMARQLTEAGEHVALLALIDCVTPQCFFDSQSRGAPSLWARLTRLTTKNPAELLETLKNQARKATGRLRPTAEETPEDSEVQLADLISLESMPAAYHDSASRHFNAMRDYLPEPFPGDAILFRSDHEKMDPDLGWGAIVKGTLKIENIPGHHSDVLREPHLQVAGKKIAAATEAAIETTP